MAAQFGMVLVFGKYLRVLRRDGKIYVSYNDYAKGVGIWATNGAYQRMICESQGKSNILISFSRTSSDPTYPTHFQDSMLWLSVEDVDTFFELVEGRQKPSDPMAPQRMSEFASSIKTARLLQFNKKKYIGTSSLKFDITKKEDNVLPWEVVQTPLNPEVEKMVRDTWLVAMRRAKLAGSLHPLLPPGIGDRIKAEAWAQVNAEWTEPASPDVSGIVNLQEYKRRA